ncbi:WD and tetratricopeptide repeats protein 1 [Bacillus rossius redtenbacheri]|uniref:WD and tetratricopeptide repeats protein 1 n=1 Tax=Bacillus rossius redtenbacheri TaxID=93214 RepID=UPI002FDCE0A4
MNRKQVPSGCNIARLVQQRETRDALCYNLQQKLHATTYFVKRLGLEKELEGHNGCVNCLEWNESGTTLASASDDVQVILWDPFRYRKIHTITTGHHGNIFSVKFLPKSGDAVLVTGAGDSRIRVHDINLGETTHMCSCHTGRVKRLATAPNVPYMFWSAAEDGLIMQFDLRMPHSCSREVSNVLVNLLSHMGRYAEAKCLAINPRRPELLAVGANDPYVRVYDRRMIKPTTVQYPPDSMLRSNWERQDYMAKRAGSRNRTDNLSAGCVQYFVAGHLPVKLQDYKKKYRNLASTYVTFSPDGNDLLVNLGGEQIYLFDINSRRKPTRFQIQSLELGGIKAFCKEHCDVTNGYSNGFRNGTNGFATSSNSVSFNANGVASVLLPSQSPPVADKKSKREKMPLANNIELLKLKANEAFEQQLYTDAITLYNRAISLCPNAAVLFGNRAAAYMKRGWDGDVYAAMRDCHAALQLDPGHVKAHFRLARCLLELQWIQEATDCLNAFKVRFPEHTHSHACKALCKDIEAASNTTATNVKSSPDIADAEVADLDGPSSSEEGSSGGGEQPKQSAHSWSLPSQQEEAWCAAAWDYEVRFCGHCNTTTDIKEANFFGNEGQFIVAGSDDGSFFVWERSTTNIIRVLKGDDSIVNCLQPHPSYCLLATSGIDPVVRLWSPRPEDGSKNDREVEDLYDAASANQKRMNADPFEVMLRNLGYRITSVQGEDGDSSDDGPRDGAAINCRAS